MIPVQHKQTIIEALQEVRLNVAAAISYSSSPRLLLQDLARIDAALEWLAQQDVPPAPMHARVLVDYAEMSAAPPGVMEAARKVTAWLDGMAGYTQEQQPTE